MSQAHMSSSVLSLEVTCVCISTNVAFIISVSFCVGSSLP